MQMGVEACRSCQQSVINFPFGLWAGFWMWSSSAILSRRVSTSTGPAVSSCVLSNRKQFPFLRTRLARVIAVLGRPLEVARVSSVAGSDQSSRCVW